VRQLLIVVALLMFSSVAFASNEPQVEIVVNPTARLTKRWVFVVDNSDSMKGVFHKAIAGWQKLTEAGTDDWMFSVIVFSNTGQERWFMPKLHGKRVRWLPATPDMFTLARKWIEHPKQRGTNSRASRAIDWALRTLVKELSVVIISDGGFTSACENRGFSYLRSVVAKAQRWRVLQGLDSALITTIGVRNTHYSAWCTRCIRTRSKTRHDYTLPDHWVSNIGKKPSDEDCQKFLRELGTVYHGGYAIVEHKEPPVKKTTQTKRPVRTVVRPSPVRSARQ
jgi:hypothetical protein